MTMFITITVHTETAAIGGGRARKSRLAWSCAASASCARWCVCVHHCCEHDNDDDDVCFRLVNFRGRRRRLVASWRQWDAPMRRDRLQSTALVRASNQPDVAPTRERAGGGHAQSRHGAPDDFPATIARFRTSFFDAIVRVPPLGHTPRALRRGSRAGTPARVASTHRCVFARAARRSSSCDE